MTDIIYKSPQVVQCYSPLFGCDPELFFSKNGSVIGAERVIPEGKLAAPNVGGRGTTYQGLTNFSAFVLDGVQVELNPNPHGCRANLADELSAAFRTLKQHLVKMGDVNVDFSSVITIDPKELAALSENSRRFGCAPSFNSYDTAPKVMANPATYLKRSAGGHIHLGLTKLEGYCRKPIDGGELMNHRERLIPILDTLLGNTCVMLDRDPEAAERRKNYGRAGEYRLPSHGIEYRTLSNFWLQSYQLFSFVMGVARLAVSVLGTTVYPGGWDAETALLSRVSLDEVKQAINDNNIELAKKNWQGVRSFIADHVTTRLDDGTGLESGLLTQFDFFLKKVEEQGLKYWWPDDPMVHWCTRGNGHGTGIESFLGQTVSTRMRLEANAGVIA